MYPDCIRNLIEAFKFFPGIGDKTAERLAFSVLNLENEQVDFFLKSLSDVSIKIHPCPICNTITDKDICAICSDKLRNSNILCVVEDSKSVFLFEKLDGINPEDIGLSKLFDRIQNGNFKEIIFAFRPNIEGETTSLYIKRVLDNLDIKFTRLASGLPIGADMEYIDGLTLERALNDRKEIE